MPYFVFLEFTDPKVREFLHSLRESITGRVDTKTAHITVRGPYDNVPEPGLIEQLNDEIKGHGVIIGGAGMFDTSPGYAVYLKVQSPTFSKIWWKPDYSIEQFGIHPHVTIYETNNLKDAQMVEKFLRKERIEIFTFNTVLTVNMSKQSNLFEANIDPELKKRRSSIYMKWSVKPGILQRAKVLGESLETR